MVLRSVLHANECVTKEPLPDYDRFVDAAYNFCTVRHLEAWDLKMLDVINGDMRLQYEERLKELERQKEKAVRRARREKEEKERQARIKRDEDRARKDATSSAFL